ncbi:MAG: hypothetical protein BWY68_00136 [bacterium ADurb.Bin400]|nr:MAG: hypothetical protein BWY68_00136 [bacterium ADurb.Bin400]
MKPIWRVIAYLLFAAIVVNTIVFDVAGTHAADPAPTPTPGGDDYYKNVNTCKLNVLAQIVAGTSYSHPSQDALVFLSDGSRNRLQHNYKAPGNSETQSKTYIYEKSEPISGSTTGKRLVFKSEELDVYRLAFDFDPSRAQNDGQISSSFKVYNPTNTPTAGTGNSYWDAMGNDMNMKIDCRYFQGNVNATLGKNANEPPHIVIPGTGNSADRRLRDTQYLLHKVVSEKFGGDWTKHNFYFVYQHSVIPGTTGTRREDGMEKLSVRLTFGGRVGNDTVIHAVGFGDINNSLDDSDKSGSPVKHLGSAGVTIDDNAIRQHLYNWVFATHTSSVTASPSGTGASSSVTTATCGTMPSPDAGGTQQSNLTEDPKPKCINLNGVHASASGTPTSWLKSWFASAPSTQLAAAAASGVASGAADDTLASPGGGGGGGSTTETATVCGEIVGTASGFDFGGRIQKAIEGALCSAAYFFYNLVGTFYQSALEWLQASIGVHLK